MRMRTENGKAGRAGAALTGMGETEKRARTAMGRALLAVANVLPAA